MLERQSGLRMGELTSSAAMMRPWAVGKRDLLSELNEIPS